MTAKTTTVASYTVEHLRFLDEHGQPTQTLPEFAEDVSFLQSLYQSMVELRTFDTKAIALQRTGKMGTYASTLGQEAVFVALGAAMAPEDVLCPYYRDYGTQLARGVTMEDILRYWGGDERGSDFKGCLEDLPICVPIASQLLHAVGVAYAFQYRNQARVAVTTVGDGGTSKGDFYEALNMAGLKKLPMVFVINNNQYAISVPLKEQTGCHTLAQKGISGEVRSIQVDGNDIIALFHAMQEAVQNARQGEGPTLIEAMTYRMCDHTTADDARRYRSEEEVAKHKKEDPILRLRTFLAERNHWNEERERALIQSAQNKVATVVENYMKTPTRPAASMFNHLYATLPLALHAQKEEVARLGGPHHG